MIELASGDIVQADVEALVNTVNCVGVMGRGIALQFRKAFPGNFKDYKAACDRGEVRPGEMFVHDLGRLTNPRYVINFPTKRHWKGNSRMEDIDSGLEALVDVIREKRIHSIAIPPLGSGLGGLDWREVRPKIEASLEQLEDVRILLFQPVGAPDSSLMVKEKRTPNMTIGRASLLCLMRRYLAAVMDPSVSLLEIHKLMYFLQESGENLRLRYQKAPLGPYADNLRHVLSAIEGHFIIGYGDAGDQPDKQLEVLPGVWERAEETLVNNPNTYTKFDRVANLIDGFETPFGMELLATVHWVVTREGASNEDEAIEKTYDWNDRKSSFHEAHIRTAYQVLREQEWFDLDPQNVG
jgi:O-acetyl-ADP-ribose deacetylase (regulator of RNase III)